jgi:hypothetical protein
MTLRQLTTVKKLLLINFLLLLLFQIFNGFKELDDYLVIFIFVLFLNDLYLKLTTPPEILFQQKHDKRIWVTVFLLFILVMPFLFDYFHVKNSTQLFLSKIGFILWAQAFLLDSFMHYKETHSKKWLVFANVGVIFTVFFSFVI